MLNSSAAYDRAIYQVARWCDERSSVRIRFISGHGRSSFPGVYHEVDVRNDGCPFCVVTPETTRAPSASPLRINLVYMRSEQWVKRYAHFLKD